MLGLLGLRIWTKDYTMCGKEYPNLVSELELKSQWQNFKIDLLLKALELHRRPNPWMLALRIPAESSFWLWIATRLRVWTLRIWWDWQKELKNQAWASQSPTYSLIIKAQNLICCYESPKSATHRSYRIPPTCPSSPLSFKPHPSPLEPVVFSPILPVRPQVLHWSRLR